MKSLIENILAQALNDLPELREAAGELALGTTVERTRDASHGDFASNVAMRLAKPAKRKPRDLANDIVAALPDVDDIAKVEIAGPGFINFHLSEAAFHREIRNVIAAGDDYGTQPKRSTPQVLLEFVSANPTGPLHVGHGRHGAYGATLGNLLEAAGYAVSREYYVNDAGRQMDILGVSVWLRLLESEGKDITFPDAGYKGDYIGDIAATVDQTGLANVNAEELLHDLPPDAPDGNKEAHIEALIHRAKNLLGDEHFDRVRQHSLEAIRDDIEDDLAAFGVTFDTWYSEQSLTKTGRIDDALAVLKSRGMLYEKDGATWFPSSQFGDEKDRVVVRDNGVKTYFASDIAYHFDKRERGFDLLIDVLGADHHGYVSRVRGGLEAMGYAGDDLTVELVQFVSLYRNGKKAQMSTRSGEFDTLRQLREEVGNDAARLFYVSRSNDQHLDFDLDIAKSQSNDNPVYYIQYAHARIANVGRQLTEKGFERPSNDVALDALIEPQEQALYRALSRYPEIIDLAARNRAPQHLVHYLRDLANDFHSWYNAHFFLVDETDVRNARLLLCDATRVVLANGLKILGVSAPESM